MDAETVPVTRRIVQCALALLALWLAGCEPPSGGAAGTPPPGPLLYVANAADGTITRLESANDRVVGAPLPAGPAPWQMAVGSTGGMLVVAAGASTNRTLTYVTPSAGVWRARPLVLERGAQQLLLAGDSKWFAAVAYAVLPAGSQGVAPRCRLALVDLRTGAIVRIHTPCGVRENITSVALETTAAGTTAFLGLSSWHEEEGRRWRDRNGQVVALDAETGLAWGTYPMAGWPRSVFVAPAPGRQGRRLYCLAAVPGVSWDGREDEDSWLYTSGGQLRLLGFDPATLSSLGGRELSFQPASLAIAPDGNHAYGLTGLGSQVFHLDLATGAATLLARLGSFGAFDLAVTDKRVYVVGPFGSDIWVLDRERGRLLKTVQVGRHPIGITAVGSDRA